MKRRTGAGERITAYVDDGELVKHTPFLRAALQRLGVRDEEVDDLVQETLFRAWSSMSAGLFRPLRGDPLVGALRAWLLGVARRRAAQAYARGHVWHEVACADPGAAGGGARALGSSPEDQVAAREALRALQRLQPELAAVLGHIAAGRTIVETAEALGVPFGTAATRLRAARRELRRILAD